MYRRPNAKKRSACDVYESRVREFRRNFGFIETEIPEEMPEVYQRVITSGKNRRNNFRELSAREGDASFRETLAAIASHDSQ